MQRCLNKIYVSFRSSSNNLNHNITVYTNVIKSQVAKPLDGN